MKWNLFQKIFLAVAVVAVTGGILAMEYARPASAWRGTVEASAEKQSNSKTDLELAQKIRQSIYADKSLSIAAQNVTVVTQDGKVTLRGAVRSEAEKESLLDKVNHVAGGANVASDIQVVPGR